MDQTERLKLSDAERRRYSREELFRLAGLMKEFEGVLADELEELKNANWTRYQVEFDSGADWDPPNGPASLASWGRKKSELIGEFPESGGRYFIGSHRKMHRMTSSPSIKYNKSEPPELGTLSSQVQAKYARLIETLSKSKPPVQSPPPPPASSSQRRYELPPSRPNRTGATSHNSERLDESNPRRPTNVFGPLRRRPADDRRGSDEPMSLPYSINMHAQRDEPQVQMDDSRGASQQLLAAHFETPIRRIGAQTQARAHEDERQRPADCPSDMEEDDFDITSLLSITVLSDIRTIRQDSSSALGGLTRQSSKPLLRRAKSNDMAVRMPARARTSLELGFSPESRRPGAAQNLILSPAHAAFARQAVPYGTQASQQYSSLNETSASYAWRASQQNQSSGLFVDPEVALKYHLERAQSGHATKTHSAGPQSSAHKAPVDEKVVKIIETFKAQVRARAEAPESEPAQNKKQQPPGSAPSGHQPKEDGGKLAGELKEEATSERVAASASPPEVHSQKADREAAETRTETGGRQPQPQARPPPSSVATASRVSNIPRLISLHRPHSGQPSAGDALKLSTEASNNPVHPEASSAGAPGQSKTNDPSGGSRSNIKAGNKFTSQYRSLRGKSLADEVEESSPK